MVIYIRARPDELKNYHTLAFILNSALYEALQSSPLEIVEHTLAMKVPVYFKL